MLFVHILLGGAFPKRHRANYGVFAIIRKVPILGRHRSELAVDLLDVLAGLCIVGESTPFLFFSVPSIQIRRPGLEPHTESV
jgi:hypothetical protein